MPASIGVNLRVTGHCRQGGRKYMEDFFSVAYQQTEDERDLEYAFFGIYDGHGGAEAAAFAKERLMETIVRHKNFWSDNDEEVLRAIKLGYIATHYAMWKEQDKWPRTTSGLPSTAGTTASIAFIRRGKIYIGHVGDSGIVLGYQEPGCLEWKAKPLTRDHKPECAVEMTRIEQCGGKVVAKSGVPRVVWNRPRIGHKGPVRRSTPIDEIPFLAVARSLGDLWSYNSELDEFVVSPDPDCSVIPIDTSTFRCLIFGTDGLYNMLSPQMAVHIVQQAEKHNEEAALSDSPNKVWLNPSKCLVERALELWSTTKMRADNTSVVTLMLDPPGPPRAQVLRNRKKNYADSGLQIVTRYQNEAAPEQSKDAHKAAIIPEHNPQLPRTSVWYRSSAVVDNDAPTQRSAGEDVRPHPPPSDGVQDAAAPPPADQKNEDFSLKLRESLGYDPRSPVTTNLADVAAAKTSDASTSSAAAAVSRTSDFRTCRISESRTESEEVTVHDVRVHAVKIVETRSATVKKIAKAAPRCWPASRSCDAKGGVDTRHQPVRGVKSKSRATGSPEPEDACVRVGPVFKSPLARSLIARGGVGHLDADSKTAGFNCRNSDFETFASTSYVDVGQCVCCDETVRGSDGDQSSGCCDNGRKVEGLFGSQFESATRYDAQQVSDGYDAPLPRSSRHHDDYDDAAAVACCQKCRCGDRDGAAAPSNAADAPARKYEENIQIHEISSSSNDVDECADIGGVAAAVSRSLRSKRGKLRNVLKFQRKRTAKKFEAIGRRRPPECEVEPPPAAAKRRKTALDPVTRHSLRVRGRPEVTADYSLGNVDVARDQVPRLRERKKAAATVVVVTSSSSSKTDDRSAPTSTNSRVRQVSMKLRDTSSISYKDGAAGGVLSKKKKSNDNKKKVAGKSTSIAQKLKRKVKGGLVRGKIGKATADKETFRIAEGGSSRVKKENVTSATTGASQNRRGDVDGSRAYNLNSTSVYNRSNTSNGAGGVRDAKKTRSASILNKENRKTDGKRSSRCGPKGGLLHDSNGGGAAVRSKAEAKSSKATRKIQDRTFKVGYLHKLRKRVAYRNQNK